MNSQSVIFQNSGELDIRAVTTFGCSVKETDNPIGFFGTGFKYALAVLLRNKQSVIIQSGTRVYHPFLKRETIRGKEFDLVYLDKETPLGFTTELGKNWEVWMAYRELYCNAMDERDPSIYTYSGPPVIERKETTRIIVTGDLIQRDHRNQGQFILQSTPEWTFGDLEVHSRPSQSLFYKGIKVHQFDKPALFTYNFITKIDLTEDRTAKDMYNVMCRIARAIMKHGDKRYLEQSLVAPEGYFEQQIDYHGWGVEPDPSFYETIKELQRANLMKVNKSALRQWREKGQGYLDPVRLQLNPIQAHQLHKASEFCTKMGFPVVEEYPVIVVKQLGDNVLAIADRVGKQIMLSERLFEEGGTKLVARALIEEYLHLKYHFDDCSLGMQNYLFNKMISQAELILGESL